MLAHIVDKSFLLFFWVKHTWWHNFNISIFAQISYCIYFKYPLSSLDHNFFITGLHIMITILISTSSTVWGILSIFCIQNAVKPKKIYARKIANAKLQIFAPRACERVSEYIPIWDRQRFGTTSGLRYFTKISDRQRSRFKIGYL